MGFSEKERPHNDDDEKSAKANAPHGRRRSSVAGRRGSVSSRRGSTTSNEEESPKKGMLAAASSVGGQGLNTFTYEDDRYDGERQEAVIQKLSEQVQQLGDLKEDFPDDPVFLPPTENSLSKYNILANRSKDLSMWCFREEVSQDLMFQKDDLGNILFRYDGEYLQDKDGRKYHHGHATVRFRNGIQFVGMFHMGRPEGKALISFPSSSIYDGGIVQGSAHGEGKFVWSAPPDWPADKKFRKEYSGWFEQGSLTSRKRKSLFVLNKDIYQGEFEDGFAHGKGTFLWEDGRYFTGEFVNGKVHGEGKLVYPDGTEQQGRFEPCTAYWYTPLKIPPSFWPGVLFLLCLLLCLLLSLPGS